MSFWLKIYKKASRIKMETIITEIEKLTQPAEPLAFLTETGAQTEEGSEIVKKIKTVMEQDINLLALAAPQIGINKRIFCLRFNDQIKTFINPIITKKKGLNIIIETCASLPGKEIVIGRPEEITVVYYNEEFNYEDNKLLGVAACLFDQQAQILDGVLPCELGLVSDIELDGKIEETDLVDIIPFYKETFLPSKLSSLQTAIEADEEAAKDYKQLKFTEGVINGRIAVVESDESVKKRTKAKRVADKAIISMNKAEKAAQKRDFTNFVKNLSKKSHK
jgi:peptide deformylase